MKRILELTVFVCGAVVMVLELVGSRILGPYFGTSIYVWTSLIGIFLGSLSLGYYWGGKLADRLASLSILSSLILAAGLSIGTTLVIKDTLLVALTRISMDPKFATLLAAALLFLLPSLFLGMVSPYAAKLKLDSLAGAGAEIGKLYALSTAGSIAGTFLAGFYLIPTFGSDKILLILTAILIVLSLVIIYASLRLYLVVCLLFAAGWLTLNEINQTKLARNFVDIETAYNRIWIYDRAREGDNRRIRTLGINAENHSSIFLDSDELVNEYTKYFHLARHFYPDFRAALMLGGAGYSFPKDFLKVYPAATLDVVEIDPRVTSLAREYFRLEYNVRLRVIHEDARVVLNQSSDQYDVIFGDAFSSRNSPPFHLTTREAVRRQFDLLRDKGVAIVNLISAIEGDKGKFLRAEYATYREVFPQVFLFPVASDDPAEVQNVILVALKSEDKVVLQSSDPDLDVYLKRHWANDIPQDLPVLTDDYAPVEYYINSLI